MTDSILDPTVETFYAAVANLDSENVWENAIKEVFAAIAPSSPIPSDIDYALDGFSRALDAIIETWNSIAPDQSHLGDAHGGSEDAR